MKKTIMTLFLVVNLHAISYEELLELAIKNNITLELIQSKKEQQFLKTQIDTRLKNPSLDLSIANFSRARPIRRNKIGSSVGLSQSLLLPWVKKDKEILGEHKVLVLEQSYELEKIDFIYDFSMKYLDYKESLKLQALGEEALSITMRIMHIAKERYERGTALKSDYLQAKIEHKDFLNSVKLSSLQVYNALNYLQKIANVKNKISFEDEHIFSLIKTAEIHPALLLTEKKKELSKVHSKLRTYVLESFEVFSEIEEEPEEDIFRIGVRIPLAIFNDKSEEKQLAKIEQVNYALELKNQKKTLLIELEQLIGEKLMLEEMLVEYESLSKEKDILVKTYQKGYGIAKINLLEFQMSKKSFIENQEKIIKTKLAIERNIVQTNYLQGSLI